MSATALDTHRIVKRLIQAGFSDVQAETMTDVVLETHQQSMSDLATKGDLKQEVGLLRSELKSGLFELRAELKGDISELRAELKGDITELRAELKGDIAELRAELKADKADMLKWVIGMLFVQGGVVVTLVKLVIGSH